MRALLLLLAGCGASVGTPDPSRTGANVSDSICAQRIDSGPGRDPICTLPANASFHFVEGMGEGAAYVELSSDGTYRVIEQSDVGFSVGDTSCFGQSLYDEGRWRQAPNGALLLCSSYRFRGIQTKSVDDFVHDITGYAVLPRLRDGLRRHLAAHADASFDVEPLSLELTHEEYRGMTGMKATRDELAAFADAIDAYLASGTENLVTTFVRAHESERYLLPTVFHAGMGYVDDGSEEIGFQRKHGDVSRGIDEAAFHKPAGDCQKLVSAYEPTLRLPPKIAPHCKGF